MKLTSQKEWIGVLLLILIQVVLTILIPVPWFAAVLAVCVDAILLYSILVVKRTLQLTNTEKIRQASTLAEETLSFVSEDMPVGILTWDEQEKISWINPYLEDILRHQTVSQKEQLVRTLLERSRKRNQYFQIDNSHYRFILNQEKKIAYFMDVTDQIDMTLKEKDGLPVIGIISLDNYDDAIDKMDDKEISYLNSFVTGMISDWMEEYGVFYKRLNAERFFFFARNEDLQKMREKRFDLLDQLRNRAEELTIPLTLSIGIAYGDELLDKIGVVAQSNLDIALARGGDQVVIRDVEENAKPVYFGGKSTSAGRRTRVRARAMSTALKRIVNQVGDIYIMGHRYPDMDAIGSAFGMAFLASLQGRSAKVIIDRTQIIPDVSRCLAEIDKNEELRSFVLSPTEALARIKPGDALVMVDYNRPSLSISTDVYSKFDRIVVIDHHRRGEEFPADPLLSYIESSASSASELVTELIQFESNHQKRLNKFVATLLLAGITVDTKSFSIRTTDRTFDIASYLKSCGADTSLVQYLLSTDITSYLEISKLVGESEYVTEDIVVAAGTDDQEYNSVIAAKTADTILGMSGINASFVITKREDGLVGISARSAGTVNVQLIMEALGGGGHFTNAAAQIADKTIAQVKSELLAAIKEKVEK